MYKAVCFMFLAAVLTVSILPAQTFTGIAEKNSKNLDTWYTVNLKQADVSDYMVLEERYPSDLVDSVKKAMMNGWTPFGGVSVTASSGYHYYVQAMVKYSK